MLKLKADELAVGLVERTGSIGQIQQSMPFVAAVAAGSGDPGIHAAPTLRVSKAGQLAVARGCQAAQFTSGSGFFGREGGQKLGCAAGEQFLFALKQGDEGFKDLELAGEQGGEGRRLRA